MLITGQSVINANLSCQGPLIRREGGGARRSEGSHRSVHRRYVRMRVRRDNEASAPYRRIRVFHGLFTSQALTDLLRLFPVP